MSPEYCHGVCLGAWEHTGFHWCRQQAPVSCWTKLCWSAAPLNLSEFYPEPSWSRLVLVEHIRIQGNLESNTKVKDRIKILREEPVGNLELHQVFPQASSECSRSDQLLACSPSNPGLSWSIKLVSCKYCKYWYYMVGLTEAPPQESRSPPLLLRGEVPDWFAPTLLRSEADTDWLWGQGVAQVNDKVT